MEHPSILCMQSVHHGRPETNTSEKEAPTNSGSPCGAASTGMASLFPTNVVVGAAPGNVLITAYPALWYRRFLNCCKKILPYGE